MNLKKIACRSSFEQITFETDALVKGKPRSKTQGKQPICKLHANIQHLMVYKMPGVLLLICFMVQFSKYKNDFVLLIL